MSNFPSGSIGSKIKKINFLACQLKYFLKVKHIVVSNVMLQAEINTLYKNIENTDTQVQTKWLK